jgi:HEAT repeat protein
VIGERRLNWHKELLERLTDDNDAVRQAARRSLVILGFLALNPEEGQRSNSLAPGQRVTPLAQLKQPKDFGPPPGAGRTVQVQCKQRWADWWDELDKKQPRQAALRAKTEVATESSRLAGTLVQAAATRRSELLEQYRDTKGVKYTEALAFAIPKLGPEVRLEARKMLRERLSRMTEGTLKQYLDDEDAEIRRAAALGVASRDFKAQSPRLIDLLLDPEPVVRRAAHAALKELSRKDFGPGLNPTENELNEAISQWQAWWSENKRQP